MGILDGRKQSRQAVFFIQALYLYISIDNDGVLRYNKSI